MTACWECEAIAEHVHHHHVVPKSRGGTKTVPLCEACHAKAHHRDNRMTTSALTAAALAAKRERGEKTGGAAPIGTRAAAGQLVADADEAAAVATIRELRAAGLSIRAIVDSLNADGVPARGARWHATTVARVLARDDDSTTI